MSLLVLHEPAVEDLVPALVAWEALSVEEMLRRQMFAIFPDPSVPAWDQVVV
jgi:hypothetical protein